MLTPGLLQDSRESLWTISNRGMMWLNLPPYIVASGVWLKNGYWHRLSSGFPTLVFLASNPVER